MAETVAVEDPKVINGKAVADEMQESFKAEVAALKSQGIEACLSVILVGDRKDSATYVRMKKQSAEKIGMKFILKELPADIAEADLESIIDQLNKDTTVHGLIVQLPLPSHINESKVLDRIDPAKDIDGLHPLNSGLLAQKGKEPFFIPCTPNGCMKLIERYTSLEGKRVVVIGRSNIVGVPAALLAMQRNATVTICHSRTQNLPAVVREGDIVIAAVGKAELVKKDWIKPGAIVIDVGTNAVNDSSKKLGYRLVGDVAFNEVKEVASHITPVPGGVGPMTVTMLLNNTLIAAKRLVKH